MGERHGEASSFIQTILTWASVAYGLGFMTVMCNTVRLGIPAQELIEPVQVWVGVPLAIVFYGILRGYRYFKGRSTQLGDELQIIRKQRDELADLIQRRELKAAFASLWEWMFRDAILFTIPFVRYQWVSEVRLWGLRELSGHLAQRAVGSAGDSGGAEDEGLSAPTQRESANRAQFLGHQLRRLTRLYSIAESVFIVYRLCSEALTLVVVLAGAGALYIFVAYPSLPQSWGFGAPTQVTMLLADEKVPATEPIMTSLFPASGQGERQQGAAEAKMRTTLPLTLRLVTEHAYYIELPGNRILRLSSEAVGAVLFQRKE